MSRHDVDLFIMLGCFALLCYGTSAALVAWFVRPRERSARHRR